MDERGGRGGGGKWNTVKPDKGHFERGQTSQQRTSRKHSHNQDDLSTKDKMASSDSQRRFLCTQSCTAEPLLKATPDRRTPLYNGHFAESKMNS